MVSRRDFKSRLENTSGFSVHNVQKPHGFCTLEKRFQDETLSPVSVVSKPKLASKIIDSETY